METIARESGLQSRRSAQRIVRQLEKKEVIVAVTPKTGGRGRDKATIYRLNLDYKSSANSDTTVALSDQQTATPRSRFTVEKQRPAGRESATPETTKCDIQGPKQRHPGHTNSNEQSGRVSEEGGVQEPHTPILDSKLHAEDGDNKLQPTPSSKTTSSPNRPVQASKNIVAAPAPPDEDAIVSGVWDYYLAATGKDAKLNTLTPGRLKLGKARLRECIKKAVGLQQAEELMKIAIHGIAKSPWHMGRDPKTNGQTYNDWERNVFKDYETMERLWNR
jgi:hypothetical protein